MDKKEPWKFTLDKNFDSAEDDLAAILGGAEASNPEANDPLDDSNAAKVLEIAQKYFLDRHLLSDLVDELSSLLDSRPAKKEYTLHDFKVDFLNGHREVRHETIYRLDNEIMPPTIGLVALEEFFNTPRFVRVDPKTIAPEAIREKIQLPDLTHTTIRVGDMEKSVPEGQMLWVHDMILDVRFIITYRVVMGSISMLIESSYAERNKARALFVDARDFVTTSPYFRGKILELSPHGFQIITIEDPPQPILEESIREEIVKNVHNIFSKREEFEKVLLPTRRSLILEGPPGTGKTLLCRSIAHSLQGNVTTLWVTSKAIRNAGHIAEIFNLARKLNPCFLVFEDIDLISGTREGDAECLGEMLNQLDGLKINESLVVIATTNRVADLDVALKDRPGRFDRIFQLGKPPKDVAKEIAVNFLKKRGISDDRIERLNMDFLTEGDMSGAQIEEVVKGGLVEAIFRGCEINDMCLKTSFSGLKNQRKRVMGLPE